MTSPYIKQAVEACALPITVRHVTINEWSGFHGVYDGYRVGVEARTIERATQQYVSIRDHLLKRHRLLSERKE